MSSKKEKNIYQIPDEAIRIKLIGNDDLQEAYLNRAFRKKTSKQIETPNGIITVINQTHEDLKRRFSERKGETYDLYVADRYYLDKDAMARRILVVDKGSTDCFYDAEPAIDWAATELTTEQECIRLLFLASIADQILEDESIIREIIAFLPKTQRGEIMLNHITRIASANIVTHKAKVLEMVARAKTKSEITISVEYRPFSHEELKIIEEDFLSQHLSMFGWDQIPEMPQKEATEEKSVIPEKITRFGPEPYGWKQPPEWSHSFQKYVNEKRYDGITLWFSSVWEVREEGFSYEKGVSEAERLSFSSGYLWAPLERGWSFPLEKPSGAAKVRLGKLEVHIAEGAKVYSKEINHFIFTMDKACIKDAIGRGDLSLLRERARFLSADNIEGCILFAKEEKAEECVEWLESQREIVRKHEELIGEIEGPDPETIKKLKDTEAWMNKFGYALERNPEIVIDGKTFVFSGYGQYKVQDYPVFQIIIAKGGFVRTSISGKTNYIVVNPAYAGWGKAEEAIERQEEGKSIQIILKQDLQAALGEITREEAEEEKAHLFSLIKPENLTKPEKTEETDECDDFDFDFMYDDLDDDRDDDLDFD